MTRNTVLGLCATVMLLATTCASPPETWNEGSVQHRPEADALFQDAPHWHGGDAAYSVALGNDRVLWLFGDSFVGPVTEPDTRSGSKMVRNTLAVQDGLDPSTASITFYHDDSGDEPGPFFASEDDTLWLWPGPGVRVGETLYLGWARIGPSSGGLGFETIDSLVIAVDNPDDAPPAWTWRRLALPEHRLGVQLGLGAWHIEGDWLYAFAPVEPGNHDVYLARWPLEAIAADDFSQPDLWSAQGWTPGADSAQPVVRDVQTEFSVHRAPDGALWMVSVDGFGGTNLVARMADLPQGPWSEPQLLLRPSVSDRKDILVYSAKAHPEQEGAGMLITYCTNHLDFWTMAGDMALYFPRFVEVVLE